MPETPAIPEATRPPSLRPLGLILAGGLARRMQGADKTLLRLDDGTRLLDVLLARLGPQCAALAISANGAPSRFAFADLTILADAPGPSRGPLAGVLAGLDHAAACVPRDPSGDSSLLPHGAIAFTHPASAASFPSPLWRGARGEGRTASPGGQDRQGYRDPHPHPLSTRERGNEPPMAMESGSPFGEGMPEPAQTMAGTESAASVPDGWMLTVPGDTPFVPADLVARLAAAAQAGGHAVARATCDGRRHSLVALWSCRLREPLRQALMERDLRKVTAFQAEVGVVDVPWIAAPHDPFFNVNTPDDLAMARHLYDGLQRDG